MVVQRNVPGGVVSSGNSSKIGRQLGLPMATALIVGNMIGAGIFLLPVALAPFGRTAIYGWLLTTVGVLCLSGIIAKLSAHFEGGPFAYVERAFGPGAAFMVMWSYLLSMWVGLPPLAIAGVSYFSYLEPSLAGPVIAPALAIAFIWAFVLINAQGARAGGAIQLATSILKVLPLVAVAFVASGALTAGQAAAPIMPTRFSFGALAGATALAMFSMLGFESASLTAGKVRNSRLNVPKATIFGPLIAGAIYVIAYLSIVYLIPGARTAASPAPFADAIQPLLGRKAGDVLALFAAISALGCLNGWTLCAGEVPLTLALDGVFPAWFAKTTRAGTPVRAQVAAGAVASLLVIFNYSKSLSGLFAFLALLTTVASLFLYGSLAAAAFVLARDVSKRLILPVLAAPGLAFVIFIFWGSGLEVSLWGAGLLATGLPVYWLMRRAERTTRAAETSPAAPQV